MRNFPRDTEFSFVSSYQDAAQLIINQLFGFVGSPSFNKWSSFETSAALSPVVAIGLIAALYAVIRRKPGDREQGSKSSKAPIFWGALLCVSCLMVFQLSTGVAEWVHTVKQLSPVGILPFNAFFTVALVSPLILISAYGLAKVKSEKIGGAFILVYIIGSFVSVELSKPELTSHFSLDVLPAEQIYLRFASQDVSSLGPQFIATEAPNDLIPLSTFSTNKTCLTPLFSEAPNLELKPGPISVVENDRFNFSNPACYVYPEENNCGRGEKIFTIDTANLQRLLGHENPDWRTSKLQKQANTVSFWCFVFFLLLLLVGSSLRSGAED